MIKKPEVVFKFFAMFHPGCGPSIFLALFSFENGLVWTGPYYSVRDLT